jgi:hypothetical protein
MAVTRLRSCTQRSLIEVLSENKHEIDAVMEIQEFESSTDSSNISSSESEMEDVNGSDSTDPNEVSELETYYG